MRTFKLMADYHCFPLWETHGDSTGNVDPASLPISPQLVKRLDAWAADFDSSLNLDDPINSGFPTQAAERAFHDEGQHLFQLLRDELGDGFAVTYVQA
jgi:hypothetical protein